MQEALNTSQRGNIISAKLKLNTLLKDLKERKAEAMSKERAEKLKDHEKSYQEKKLNERKKLKKKFQAM